jgi:dTDP-4-dehydro-6-deoxy-alpha-D-glucopyranose 2,3-dehydratase
MNNLMFLKSALTVDNPWNSTEDVCRWIKQQNEQIKVSVRKIKFSEMNDWHFDSHNASIRHNSGRFFSIEGVKITTNWGKVPVWKQPIINQPEIGYLGIITKKINGVLYFLLQAKVEPGNVNNVQLSPTLQATKSNYSQVHKGQKPLYLEYFQNASPKQVLLDQLQSEQGARFLKKRNRNIILKIDEDIPIYDNFIWLTLGQIKKLSQYDNVVNMDTRTVISGIPFFSYGVDSFENLLNVETDASYGSGMLLSALDNKAGIYSITEILSWMTKLKCIYELNVETIPLSNISDWVIEEDKIRHIDNRFFRVIAAEVEISNREVKKWSQPLVEPLQIGLSAFIVKKINNVYHFLVQAKLEPGNFDILEMAPTVQCLTGSYQNSTDLPFLSIVQNAAKEQIWVDTLQSEEGGRFYCEQNRHLIIEVYDDFSEKVPDNYIWMTLNQLTTFLHFNNYLNIQARSLISLINFI